MFLLDCVVDSHFNKFCMQISSNLLANAQDEDLLVTEFSIIGHTSSSSDGGGGGVGSRIGGGSTIPGSSTSASGFESRVSTSSGGSGSTENGKFQSKIL